ncbi:MAG: hypothetical protein JF589_00255 [Gemmatimonadetes bacterium]|nr:hypothetical protein [Gemmatimonadota bacterium]
MPSRPFVLVVALLLLTTRVLAAQPPAESGVARDAKTGAPLRCLHVILVDSADHAIAHTVTDSAGTFVLVAPETGIYRVGFEIFGWERLVGPVDTLHEGELRERAYPLTFAVALHGDSLTPGGDLIAALRHRESDAWHSASVATPDAAIRYPRRMALMRLSGDVVAQYVVDEQGRVPGDSWRPLTFTNDDFLTALRAHLPTMRYQPARLAGHPVCELVRNRVSFDWRSPLPLVTLFN